MGDDTPLHLGAAHGHLDIVRVLLKNKADINFVNEHGNTALHYACFWGYTGIAEELVSHGALVSVANKYGEIPLDKCSGTTAKKLHGKLLAFTKQFFTINLVLVFFRNGR
jgi:integrin-linked kinase